MILLPNIKEKFSWPKSAVEAKLVPIQNWILRWMEVIDSYSILDQLLEVTQFLDAQRSQRYL